MSTLPRRSIHALVLISLSCLVWSACSDDPKPDAAVDMSADLGASMDMNASNDMGVVEEDLSTREDMPADEGADLAVDLAVDMPSLPCVAPDEGVNTREGQPADGWRWRKGARVFPTQDETFAAGDGDFAPSIIADGDGYRLYFARKRAQGFELWTATSPAGTTWSEPVRVMGLQGENYPSAFRQADGSVRLWFGSGSIDVATSMDGVTFSDQQRRILTPTAVGQFAQASLIYADVIRDGEGYKMWFTGFDGQQLRIGTASSVDGIAWTPTATPVLSRREQGDYDNKAVGQPSVKRIGSALYMWHGGYDTSNTDPGPWRVALASSTDDGATWSRQGVSIPLAENGDDMWSTRDPAVIQKRDGSGWLMVYVGMRDDSKYRLLTATSDACLR